MRLWHVSDQGDIARFEPRLPASSDACVDWPVVWAVADTHLAAYLLPRDCPRVAMRRGDDCALEDNQRFFGASEAASIIAIETPWLARAMALPLWLYEMPTAGFDCADANAGYYVSRQAVAPLACHRIESPLLALAERGAELRIVPRLRPLAAQVAASSLAFSIIRLRHAAE